MHKKSRKILLSGTTGLSLIVLAWAAAAPADAAVSRYTFSGFIENNVSTSEDDAIAATLGVSYGDMYEGYVEFDDTLLNGAYEDPETSEVIVENSSARAVTYSLTVGNTTFSSVSDLSPFWEPTVTFARLLENDFSYQANDPDEAARDLRLWGLTVESDVETVDTTELVLMMNGITFQAPFLPGGVATASPQGGYIRVASGLADYALLLGDLVPGDITSPCTPGVDCDGDNSGGGDPPVAATPIPAALPLFASAVGLLGAFARRRRAATTA